MQCRRDLRLVGESAPPTRQLAVQIERKVSTAHGHRDVHPAARLKAFQLGFSAVRSRETQLAEAHHQRVAQLIAAQALCEQHHRLCLTRVRTVTEEPRAHRVAARTHVAERQRADALAARTLHGLVLHQSHILRRKTHQEGVEEQARWERVALVRVQRVDALGGAQHVLEEGGGRLRRRSGRRRRRCHSVRVFSTALHQRLARLGAGARVEQQRLPGQSAEVTHGLGGHHDAAHLANTIAHPERAATRGRIGVRSQPTVQEGQRTGRNVRQSERAGAGLGEDGPQLGGDLLRVGRQRARIGSGAWHTPVGALELEDATADVQQRYLLVGSLRGGLGHQRNGLCQSRAREAGHTHQLDHALQRTCSAARRRGGHQSLRRGEVVQNDAERTAIVPGAQLRQVAEHTQEHLQGLRAQRQ
mmetsp:Transcript_14703/g.44136  ORF Transcript_14703/g.44136 Transcript_14703/m.44136 type:complete len:416 (+) Transcript_14703:442-1689(+)